VKRCAALWSREERSLCAQIEKEEAAGDQARGDRRERPKWRRETTRQVYKVRVQVSEGQLVVPGWEDRKVS